MVKGKILAVVLLLFASANIFAQTSSDTVKTNSEFNTALKLYNEGQYEKAQKSFEKIVLSTFNSETTISYIFDAKSLIQIGQNTEAKKVLNDFFSLFRDSKYAAEARLMFAQIYLEEQNYDSAFIFLEEIIKSSATENYLLYAKSSGEKLALSYLPLYQVKQSYNASTNKVLKPYLLSLIAENYYYNGEQDSAKSYYERLIKIFPESYEAVKAEVFIEKFSGGKLNKISSPIIAVMLPLTNSKESSGESTASREILEGIKYAVSEFNNENSFKIGLLIKNTGRNKAKIDSIKNEVDSLSSLKAIIGPIYSDEVKEALDTFKDMDIPVISPTATDEGLTELYPDFFQANPSFSVRGKIMAEYIYFVENKKKMAILSSAGSYSAVLANSFAKEFERLGGKIITWQKFNSGSINLSEQVNKIAMDSLKVQGVYIPLNNNHDVTSILSQFVLSNLNLTIYANQDWLLAKGLETSSDLSDKLVISSDYFLDYNDSTFQQFDKNFYARTGINVNRNVLYGYDISKYLLSFIHDPDISRSKLKTDLESGSVYVGLHNNIYFAKDRINKFINIIRYRNGKFELVDKFKAGN